MRTLNITLIFILAFSIFSVAGNKKSETKNDTLKSSTFSGLKWRSIGPAFASGRIADFAVDPRNSAHYYVAVSAGHVWETTNNGYTFSPIFDNHGVYSIGVISMDPSNPNILWIGTGENNHQRAIGYGNGIYKSVDGGKSWKNMGLKESRQIGEIIIHPTNSDIIYVAAEGSIWTDNEERGVFKSTDGGKTWTKSLYVSKNTGIASLCFDPNNPEVIYAGAEQRRRKQYTKIGGGPESAFYKTTDSGRSWNKLENGIPKVDKGGMAITVSSVNSDIVYAMFEASEGKGGFYRSTNRGGSFTKMNDYYSSGQYYSEIYCDPVDENKVYSVDTRSRFSYDGGKTWKNISTKNRHVDDHALWIDPQNNKHFLIGGDGGAYETWDEGKSFIHKTTLPVVQYYRVNTDNSYPYYWVYGGTQDNNSMGGPSQNLYNGGVTSAEWVVTLGGDGFWQAIDPTDQNIVYSAYQYGNIFRFDKKSGEKIKVRPEPRKDEFTYRWNWDSPFILSKHNNKRLYIAANKLFKSDDRGNTWQVISEDLTRNEDRNQFKVMGKYWPANAVAKDVSTSQWGTIVSLSESPIKQGLIYVGTDDGLIQITEDDGKTWRKVSEFPNIQKYTFVSDSVACKHNENVVYATFNNLKEDDFKPYVLVSSDKGKTWKSISSDLPENGSVHTINQDPVKDNLLFIGTEFGIYFSINSGKNWIELASGIPDIAVRDIAIQEREKDLVIATFGRGFYILDDYSSLREITEEKLKTENAILFPIKDALMYVQKGSRYGAGDAYYKAKNPEFGASFTYFINDIPKTKKAIRLEKEKELFKNGERIPQPKKQQLDEEKNETEPYLIFTIKDSKGSIVRKIFKKASKGINKVNWNLRYSTTTPINISNNTYDNLKNGGDRFYALPGKYSVELSMAFTDSVVKLTNSQEFNTKFINNSSIKVENRAEIDKFYNNVAELWRVTSGAEKYLNNLISKTNYIAQALHNVNNSTLEQEKSAKAILIDLEKIEFKLDGTKAKASWEEVPPAQMPLNVRLGELLWASWQSSGNPTSTQKMNYSILLEEYKSVLESIKNQDNKIKELDKTLDKINAPYTPDRLPILK